MSGSEGKTEARADPRMKTRSYVRGPKWAVEDGRDGGKEEAWPLGRRRATVTVQLIALELGEGSIDERVYNLEPVSVQQEKRQLGADAGDYAFRRYGSGRRGHTSTDTTMGWVTVHCAWTRLSETDQRRVASALENPRNWALSSMLQLLTQNIEEPDSTVEFHSITVTGGARRRPRVTVDLSYCNTRASPQTLFDRIASETRGESAFKHARGGNSNDWRVEWWEWDPKLDRARHPSSPKVAALALDLEKSITIVDMPRMVKFKWDLPKGARCDSQEGAVVAPRRTSQTSRLWHVARLPPLMHTLETDT